ncbi:MAG: hypothetical protein IPG71_12095 [bacterium]|nr:hypothetical protein [bacterium]
MKKTLLSVLIVAVCATSGFSVPKVVVFPFQPVMDTTYNIWGDPVKVLNYQLALQSFLVSDFAQSVDVEVEKSDLAVKTVNEAIEIARRSEADFAVVGTFAELPTAIRGDAQLADVALGQVPRGYQASSTASRWEDLSAVADDLAQQLLSFISGSSTIRSESASRLILEGDRVALGYDPGNQPHLVVEVNSPAPKITLGDGTQLKRCSVRDRSLAEGTQNTQICYAGEVSAGELTVQIDQRGYYGHSETLSLSPGKVYRLVVELNKMSFQAAPGRP